jgi:hypothetical protein
MLQGGPVSALRRNDVEYCERAYNPSSFMQANTLCSVIFSRQNEKNMVFLGFFKDPNVSLQSPLLMQTSFLCDVILGF